MSLADGTGAWTAPDGGGTRVLVVDDEADTAELFARVLGERGYMVATASDGPTALQRAEQFVPQIALLDLGLPWIDGYEVGRQLREDIPDVRLVAITAYGQRGDRARSRGAGFAAHLVKPVSIREILETLRDVRASLPIPLREAGLTELELAHLEEELAAAPIVGPPVGPLGWGGRAGGH